MIVVVCVSSVSSSSTSSYGFLYSVYDPKTGDIKDQNEVKIGDQVYGYYRLLDADGMVRTVNYDSNPLTGFRAHVNRVPLIVVGASLAESVRYAQTVAPIWSEMSVEPTKLATVEKPVKLAPAVHSSKLVPETKEIKYMQTSLPSIVYDELARDFYHTSGPAVYPVPTSYQTIDPSPDYGTSYSETSV